LKGTNDLRGQEKHTIGRSTKGVINGTKKKNKNQKKKKKPQKTKKKKNKNKNKAHPPKKKTHKLISTAPNNEWSGPADLDNYWEKEVM